MLYNTSHLFKHPLIIFALAVATAACDGPVGPSGPIGPQGPAGEDGANGQDGADGQDGENGADGQQGPAGPQGPAGEDGNANVTLYITVGHNFAASSSAQRLINGVDTGVENTWLVYLVEGGWKYLIPGFGPSGASEYRAQHDVASGFGTLDVRINRASGPGESFDNIYIFRIETSTVVECPPTGICSGVFRTRSEGGVPSDLDVSDYDAVVEYYGITEDDIVRM